VKGAFETVFKAMVSLLGRDLRNSTQPPEGTAMAIAALCIGGMVVARAMNDDGLGNRLREAAIRVALELGGWDTATGLLSTESASSNRRVAAKRVRKHAAPQARRSKTTA
jgi:TetR/AcrR family transcriptional repressor of nem operon